MSDLTHAWVAHYNADRKLHVSVLAERLLYSGDEMYGGTVAFLSVLGPHSAVKGVLAALSTGRDLRATPWPSARFLGASGSRIVTHALTKEVTHGAYLSPELLLARDEHVRVVAVLDPTPERILDRLTQAHALPTKPEWAPWLASRLESDGRLKPCLGFGAKGCRIDATEDQLDSLLGEGVRSGALRF